MSSYVPLLLAADIHAQYTPQDLEEERIRQLALLEMFFEDIHPDDRGYFGEIPFDYAENYDNCIGFQNGLVKQVHYIYKNVGNFNIHALPHSTTSISLHSCHQKYSIQTRMLPNKLKHLGFNNNEIFGTFDLTNLPPFFVSLAAHANHICGPITLTNLPVTLKTIELRGNDINQSVVFYANLPPRIEKIFLSHQCLYWGAVGFQAIRGVQVISEEHKISDARAKRVFPMVSHYDPSG